MSASDRHDKITSEFVRAIGHGTKTHAELMVAIESTLLAAMLLSIRLYGIKPADTSTFMETALHRATERLSEKLGKS